MNIASIDIGSNSVILLIAKLNGPENKFEVLGNWYTTPRISSNLSKNSNFDTLSIERLKSILSGFLDISHEYKCEKIIACATQAFRKANNASDTVKSIKVDLGIEIKILTGKEEAFITYLGATSIFPSFEGSLIDIGGGSTEFTLGHGSEIIFSHSYDFGAVTIHDLFKAAPPIQQVKIESIKSYVCDYLKQNIPSKTFGKTHIAVAGTPTTLACMQLGIKDFDEKKIEGYKLSIEEINHLIQILSDMTPEKILDKYGKIVEGREDIILCGALILSSIMKFQEIQKIYVSTRGLRHGIIFNYIKSDACNTFLP